MLPTLPGLYHSSKAAVTIMSETLRLELAPLDVTVITAMLGNIESNFHVNDSWQGLPATSNYKSVQTQIAKTAEGKIGPKKEKAEDFARRFAEDILGGTSGQVWRGAMAQTVRVLAYHAPARVLVRDDAVFEYRVSMESVRADLNDRMVWFCPVPDWMSWRRKLQGSSSMCSGSPYGDVWAQRVCSVLYES